MKRKQANNQQANNQQANKQQANQGMREEFGSETDFREVQQQNNKAEQKKAQASGQFAKKQNNNQ